MYYYTIGSPKDLSSGLSMIILNPCTAATYMLHISTPDHPHLILPNKNYFHEIVRENLRAWGKRLGTSQVRYRL